ncbi:hypothetical protein K3495_g13262 [Podosphaera aphanis]|nr:hypothetical protein K3495_g13262 [Podosphaera aphanis]
MFRIRYPHALAHYLPRTRGMHTIRDVPRRPAARAPQRRPPVAYFSAHAPPAADPPLKSWTFAEVRAIAQRVAAVDPTAPSIVLIDVREPAELAATGTIPQSRHLPRSVAQDAFVVTEAEFRQRFGFARPAKDVEVVFFCKSGVRSLGAALDAHKAGWTRVGNYSGSWIDWVQNGGEREIRREC